MALVELASFPDRMVAEMARGRLAAEGIETYLFDAGLSSLGIGSLAPARLMVEEAERAAAEAVLASL
ncbi:MAG: DUF2007 domain-containing protein [Pseudomonadota bacterium]|nr:DUF2007 domain-containing protein [Pseudomonadota bacterium]